MVLSFRFFYVLITYKIASAMGEMEKNYIDVELHMSPTVHSHYIVHIDSRDENIN